MKKHYLEVPMCKQLSVSRRDQDQLGNAYTRLRNRSVIKEQSQSETSSSSSSSIDGNDEIEMVNLNLNLEEITNKNDKIGLNESQSAKNIKIQTPEVILEDYENVKSIITTMLQLISSIKFTSYKFANVQLFELPIDLLSNLSKLILILIIFLMIPGASAINVFNQNRLNERICVCNEDYSATCSDYCPSENDLFNCKEIRSSEIKDFCVVTNAVAISSGECEWDGNDYLNNIKNEVSKYMKFKYYVSDENTCSGACIGPKITDYGSGWDYTCYSNIEVIYDVRYEVTTKLTEANYTCLTSSNSQSCNAIFTPDGSNWYCYEQDKVYTRSEVEDTTNFAETILNLLSVKHACSKKSYYSYSIPKTHAVTGQYMCTIQDYDSVEFQNGLILPMETYVDVLKMNILMATPDHLKASVRFDNEVKIGCNYYFESYLINAFKLSTEELNRQLVTISVTFGNKNTAPTGGFIVPKVSCNGGKCWYNCYVEGSITDVLAKLVCVSLRLSNIPGFKLDDFSDAEDDSICKYEDHPFCHETNYLTEMDQKKLFWFSIDQILYRLNQTLGKYYDFCQQVGTLNCGLVVETFAAASYQNRTIERFLQLFENERFFFKEDKESILNDMQDIILSEDNSMQESLDESMSEVLNNSIFSNSVDSTNSDPIQSYESTDSESSSNNFTTLNSSGSKIDRSEQSSTSMGFESSSESAQLVDSSVSLENSLDSHSESVIIESESSVSSSSLNPSSVVDSNMYVESSISNNLNSSECSSSDNEEIYSADVESQFELDSSQFKLDESSDEESTETKPSFTCTLANDLNLNPFTVLGVDQNCAVMLVDLYNTIGNRYSFRNNLIRFYEKNLGMELKTIGNVGVCVEYKFKSCQFIPYSYYCENGKSHYIYNEPCIINDTVIIDSYGSECSDNNGEVTVIDNTTNTEEITETIDEPRTRFKFILILIIVGVLILTLIFICFAMILICK